ncbi:MAG: twin-arginine translocation signal domain-containing protein, partial [Terriglobales bacterium]
MNRRDFIRLSATASAAGLSLPFNFPTAFAEANPASTVRLTLRPDRLGNRIGDDFAGLSYESAQLGNPHFFSGDNTELAGFM